MSLVKLLKLVEEEKPLEALAIADNWVGKADYTFAIRGLLREWVSDLDNAKKDLEREASDDFLIKKVSLGRILAKLGCVDEAYQLLSGLKSDQIVTCPGHHLPINFGILHSYYEAPQMAKLDIERFHNDLAYSFFLRGEEDRLKELVRTNGLLEALEKFELPSGMALREIGHELNQELNGIRGWLSPSEASVLFHFASKCPKEVSVVELGSFYGRSTICLGKGTLAGNKNPIFAIDPHKGIQSYGADHSLIELSKNLKSKGLTETVNIWRTTSIEASKEYPEKDVGLLFIDALHDYGNVKADFEAWAWKLVEGGIVLFHDTMLPGVNRFLLELLQGQSSPFQALGFRDSIFAFRRQRMVDQSINHFFAEQIMEFGQYFQEWQIADEETIKWRLSKYINKLSE